MTRIHSIIVRKPSASRDWFLQDVERCTRLVQLKPGSAAAWNLRGLANFNLGDLKGLNNAIQDFNEAVVCDPAFAETYVNRGNTFAVMDELNLALQDYDKAIRLDPLHALAYYNRGAVHANLSDLQQASADFDWAFLYNSKLMTLHWNLDEFRHDIDALNEAIGLNPGDATAYNSRGLAYIQLNSADDYYQAEKDFSRAINLAPQLSQAWYNRGKMYSKNMECNQAIHDLSEAIGIDPRNAKFYFERGHAYYEREFHRVGQHYDIEGADDSQPDDIDYDYHELQNAIRDINEAINLDSSNPMYFFERAITYMDMDRKEQAVGDFTTAILLAPEFSIAYSYRGNAYAGMGEYSRAVDDYDQAVRIGPDPLFDYLNRGRAYMALGEYDKAVGDFSKFVGSAPMKTMNAIMRSVD